MPVIEVIGLNQAQGELLEIYTDLLAKRGKLANVHQIQSLNPATIRSHMQLYMDIMFTSSPLKRATRELLAVVVSRTNNCNYCMQHHSEALLAYWKDKGKLEKILDGQDLDILDEKELSLANLAIEMTRNPVSEEKDKINASLKSLGFSDRAILDAHLVIAYFNFVNRLVLGLGVELEKEAGKGYNY